MRRVLETKIPLHADLMETPIGIDILCVNRGRIERNSEKEKGREREKETRNTTVTNDNIFPPSLLLLLFVEAHNSVCSLTMDRISVVSSHPVAFQPK